MPNITIEKRKFSFKKLVRNLTTLMTHSKEEITLKKTY